MTGENTKEPVIIYRRVGGGVFFRGGGVEGGHLILSRMKGGITPPGINND